MSILEGNTELLDIINKIHYDKIQSRANVAYDFQKVMNQIRAKLIPDDHPEVFRDMSSWQYRFQFIQISSFVLISKSWVKPLARWIGDRKVLEIMAGSGMLAHALHLEGVDILATDDFSWNETAGPNAKILAEWFKVKKMDASEAVKKYSKDRPIIVCSWPPYQCNAAYKALLKMRETNPDAIMIYIGEGGSGCCADDDFHEHINHLHNDEFQLAMRTFKSWCGIYDDAYLVN